MSKDFKKVLVKDDRLNVSDQISYAVNKGGQNMTPAQFRAISATTSNCVFNIQVPSEQTLIDRRVLWQATVQLTISGIPPVGQRLIQYGLTDALAPFPLHALTSVMTATINNNSVSINMRDVLPSILRFSDKRELMRYNGYTPVMYDTYRNYADALGANNNVLGGWTQVADNDLLPRGTFTNVAIDANPVQVNAGTQLTSVVTFTVVEPLLLSPFIYADPENNNQAFYGIQNMNFVFNFGNAARAWRTANPINIGANNYSNYSVNLTSVSNSSLLFNFLTPHPDDIMPSRNVVPYYELPRYITNVSSTIAAGTTGQVISSSLQLNQIPDKLIIFSRKVMSNQTNSDSDCFYPITGLSIQFNNQAGILSSAQPQDLVRPSANAKSACPSLFIDEEGMPLGYVFGFHRF